jgi:hypothetical protein
MKGIVLFLKTMFGSSLPAQLLPEKLLKQGYVAPRLKTLLQKLYGRHHNMIDRYKIFIRKRK